MLPYLLNCEPMARFRAKHSLYQRPTLSDKLHKAFRHLNGGSPHVAHPEISRLCCQGLVISIVDGGLGKGLGAEDHAKEDHARGEDILC